MMTDSVVALGLTSRHLVIPISEHQDTIGPMTRTVKDAAYILQAIAGADKEDNYTSTIPAGALPDYVAACNLSGLAGVRLGVPRNVISLAWDNTTGPLLHEFEQSIALLKAAGAIIVENTDFPQASEFWNSSVELDVLNADIIVNLNSYLKLLTYNPRNITTLAEVRKFTQTFPGEEYPGRNTVIWDEALQNYNNTDPRFWSVYQQNVKYGTEGGLLGTLKLHNLDGIILPAPFASSWAATVGAPIVTVPMGSQPAGTPIVKNSWGLVQVAPNIPYVNLLN